MEAKEFLNDENIVLRKKLQETEEKLSLYESILFQYLNAKIEFDSIDEATGKTNVVAILKIPELTIKTDFPGESIVKLILSDLVKK